MRRVRGDLNALHEFGEIRFAADLFKLICRAQLFDEERQIDAGGRRGHIEKTAINATMLVEIKIVGAYNRRDVVAEFRIE